MSESVLMMWINLEPIIQSEVSQKEKDKYRLKAQRSENEDHGIWSHHFMANRWGNNGNSG